MADKNGDSGLKTFFDKVGEAIKDAVALDVLTYTGNARAYVTGTKEKVKDDGGKEVEKTTKINLNWDNFFEKVTTNADATIILVAATLMKVDDDLAFFR